MGGLTYHPLRVAQLVEETADARTIVFDVPEALRETFRFKPGQHLQLHVPCGAKALPRCYSLSGTPDEPLRVTVKRVADGRASSWLCASLAAGDTLEVAKPAGVFTPRVLDSDFLMFAGGSGITPVFSILRTVLASGKGRVRLVYANRDERSIIFAAELARLSREHPQRLQVIHWLDSVSGIPSQAQLAALAQDWDHSQCFICGPSSYMDMAAAALHDLAVPHAQVHIERFVSLPDDADAAASAEPAPAPGAAAATVEVELDGAMHTVRGVVGQVLIEAIENAGLAPPYSCRAGACAACMCRVEEGDVELLTNHVLEPRDLEEGWTLSCQSVISSPKLLVRYPS